jgi:hypothetical protein
VFGRAQTSIAGVLRRLAVAGALALTVLALGVPAASAGESERIKTKGGIVTFKDRGDENFAGTTADQKYGCWKKRDGLLVDHEGVRTLGAGKRDGKDTYKLNYWHAAGSHPPHTTEHGWSPLKTAFKAATRIGDGRPK